MRKRSAHAVHLVRRLQSEADAMKFAWMLLRQKLPVLIVAAAALVSAALVSAALCGLAG